MPVLIAAVSAHCHDGPPLNNRFRPMHYDFFAFGRLDGVQALTIASISEVYTNVIELSQSVYTLKGELVRCTIYHDYFRTVHYLQALHLYIYDIFLPVFTYVRM